MLEIISKDDIYYYEDEHFAISVLIIIICLLIPVSIHVCFQDHEKYKRQSGEIKECYKVISRLLLLYTFILTFSLLFRFMTMDSRLSVKGDLYNTDLEIDCSDKPFDCCNIYDNCRLGSMNHVEYDTYVFNVEKGTTCPTLSDLVNSNEDENCEDSEFGCCYFHSTCDSYVHMGITNYSTYDRIFSKGFPHGYMNMYEPRIDSEGSNCKNVKDLVNDYSSNLEEKLTKSSVMLMLLLIVLTITPCILYKKEIKKFMRNIFVEDGMIVLDDEERNYALDDEINSTIDENEINIDHLNLRLEVESDDSSSLDSEIEMIGRV